MEFSSASDRVWTIAPGPGVLLRNWGSTFAAYNIASGDTHLLGALAGLVVQSLLAGDVDHVRLSKSLHSAPDTENHEFQSLLENTLIDLTRLGLIRARPV